MLTKIFKQWLIHATGLWLIINLYDFFTSWYETRHGGMQLFYQDGTVVTQWQRFLNHNYEQAFWIVILGGTCLVELNYHLIFRKKSLPLFLITSFAAGTFFAALLFWFNKWKFGYDSASLLSPILVFVGYGMAYAFTRDFFYQRIVKARQNLHQVKAELVALRAQISPHFFFNTLNGIYGTAINENAEKTAASIDRLSGIMRYTISEAQNEFTNLAEEIKFLEDYIALQLIRIPDKDSIRIRTSLLHDGNSQQIAPLLLIPFIENAFKYGISIDHPCSVEIDLKIADQKLDLSVVNTLFSSQHNQPGLNTGIANTAKRLELLYPGRHRLSYGVRGDQYNVQLHIDFI